MWRCSDDLEQRTLAVPGEMRQGPWSVLLGVMSLCLIGRSLGGMQQCVLCLAVPVGRMASVLGVQAGPVSQLDPVSQLGFAAAQISQLALVLVIRGPLGRVPSVAKPSPQLLVDGC